MSSYLSTSPPQDKFEAPEWPWGVLASHVLRTPCVYMAAGMEGMRVLLESAPPHPRYLSTWSPVVGGLGGAALLEEACHWGQVLGA